MLFCLAEVDGWRNVSIFIAELILETKIAHALLI